MTINSRWDTKHYYTEKDAGVIRKKNEHYSTSEKLKVGRIRREIEARREAKELGIDYRDLL